MPDTAPIVTLPEMMNAVHAVRGLLVWWIIVVHWWPGVAVRLGGWAVSLNDLMIPAFRFGTPGFAMVFGLGIGALRVAQYRQTPSGARQTARRNFVLVAGGVVVLACVRWIEILTGTEVTPGLMMSKLFYSAILYYVVAVASVPLLLRFVAHRADPTLWFAGGAVLFLVIDEILQVTIAPLPLTGIPELVKILLSAKYGLFKMSAYVLVGAAIGYELRHQYSQPGLSLRIMVWGTIALVFGLLSLYEVGGEDVLNDFGAARPWHLMIYAGVLAVLLGGSLRLNHQIQTRRAIWRQANRFLVASGILSLPLFVGHEIVLPAKGILVNLSVSDGVALLGVMGVFLAACALGYARVMRFVR